MAYESWISPNYSALRIKKWGNVACFYAHWSNFAAGKAAGSYTFEQIPSRFAPQAGYVIAPMYAGAANPVGTILVGVGGDVLFKLNTEIASGVEFTLTYVV